MGIRALAAGTATVIGTLLLAGCASAPASGDTIAAEVPAYAATPTDEQMCWQFSDVQTLIWNMKFANDQGRLIENEWDGIVRLAMREMSYIDVDETTQVGKAIAALQAEIPEARIGSHPKNPELDGDIWLSGTEAIGAACQDALTEWGTEGWVGG